MWAHEYRNKIMKIVFYHFHKRFPRRRFDIQGEAMIVAPDEIRTPRYIKEAISGP